MAKVFGGPIPGESLTREKGNSTWEQPPQFTRVDQAFKYYVELLEEDDYLEDVLTVLDSGLPLDLFVDSLLLNGEMKGRHFFDMGFLLGPLLHEYILSLAEAADIDVVEFQSDIGKNLSQKDIDLFESQFGASLGDNEEESELGNPLESLGDAVGAQEAGESFSMGEDSQEPTTPPTAPPKGSTGLFNRPAK